MNWNITFCQQAGQNKSRNQDALFNGASVFQYKLKKAETIQVETERLILGVMDGVSHSPKAEIASRYWAETLSKCTALSMPLSSQWLRENHSLFCEKLSADYFGSSTTFLACELNAAYRCKVMNVGNSRAYRITPNGDWIQLSRDHTLLAEFEEQGMAQKGKAYSGIYSALSDCLIVDSQETDFHIFSETYQLEQGDSLLLCSDGLIDDISETMRKKIWQHYSSPKERLTAFRKFVQKQRNFDDLSLIVCEL